MVSEAYGDSAEAALKHALQVPKHDPAPLAALIAAATTRLGVVATMSTLAYPPFMLARLCSTLDHIAGGRFGWNIVTSGEDTAAQNFGLDKLPPREQRYEMADEYVDLVCKLFELVGSGRGGDGPRQRHLCRLPQGPADPFRGQVLQGPRPAEHRALAAGQAGVRAGRRLAARPGLRREACGLDHRHRQRHRRHEAVPRRRAPPRGVIRAQPRRHQGAVPGLSDPGRDRRRGARRSGSGWCPRRTSSSERWPAPRR